MRLGLALVAWLLSTASAFAATPFSLSYSGRLVDQTGKPLVGDAELEVSFYDDPTAGTLLKGPLTFHAVKLSDGVFQLDFALVPADFHAVFGGTAQTYVEIKDVTVAATPKKYGRQKFTAVPYALKVPIDNQSMGYDADGNLGLATQSANPGDFLKFVGGKWVPGAVTGASGGTVTDVIAGAGLAGGVVSNGSTGTLSIPASGVTNTMLAGSIAQAKVTNLTSDLATLASGVAGKAATSHSHAEADVTGLVADLAGKAAASHGHAESEVTGLVADLAGKAAASHGHAEADVTGLVADLAAKASTTHAHHSLESANGSVANAVFVDNGGNVGIGTTSPTLPLQLAGTAGLPANSGTAQNGALRLGPTGSTKVLDFGVSTSFGSSPTWIQANDSSNLAMPHSLALNPNGGKVYVGFFPGATIQVGESLIAAGATGIAAATTDVSGSTGVGSKLILKTGASTGTTYGLINVTNGDNTVARDLVLQSSGGNVGIGTTGPIAKLDVAGEVKLGTGSTTCSATAAGMIRYNSTTKRSEACSGFDGGTTWSWAILGKKMLTGTATYYVRPDGSDANTGLVNNAGGAFLTIGKAMNTIYEFDLNGNNAFIRLADGTYTGGIYMYDMPGNGAIFVFGNTANPQNVILDVSGGAVQVGGQARLVIGGFEVRTSTSGAGVSAFEHGLISVTNLRFGTCVGAHMSASYDARIDVISPYAVTGSAPWHAYAERGGHIELNGGGGTLVGTPNFSTAFAEATMGGEISVPVATYAGTAATGVRYKASMNGIIYTGTSGNATYLPGDTAGTAVNGGVYY